MKDKIMLVYQDNYPWDIRIEKFLITLSEKYEVHLICRNKNLNIESESLAKDIYVHRFPIKLSKIKIISEPFHLNAFWHSFVNSMMNEINPKCVIVRNLPLAKLVIKSSKKRNIPVIFDNAENYPEFIRFFEKYDNVVFRLLDKGGYFENLENYCVKNADFTINVIEENTNRIKEKLENVDAKMDEIYNVPYKIKNQILKQKINPNIFNICYIGALEDDKLRGVSTAIRSLKYLSNNYELTIIGDGRDADKLKDEAEELKLDNRIHFTGRLEYKDIIKYVAKFDIGIVPHMKVNMTDTTMANKIYEYMAYGLIVITTDAIPLKRFVEENDIGFVYRSGDEKDLAQKIKEATSNLELMNEMKKKNTDKHINEFNWDQEKMKLFEIIDNLR
ncbi:glycosyltransferase [Clostridium sp. YIM B02515]|uniref:Glycosyltransferase n=1 Tax=Clostridium rhizosphaerae TaxID=2803861 RepID=A0ABS1TCI1_9CLOT|nr:glycosyltransferase [Clostridium rhizosphaerae]MBL4936336.1 glycosyltransferase [Clostridium rhizosphaerae]